MRKNLFKKKILTFILMGAVMMTMASCGNSSQSSTNTDNKGAETESKEKIDVKERTVVVNNDSSGVILENGDLYMWGANYKAQVGNKSKEEEIKEPAKVLSNVSNAYSSGGNSIAITDEGYLYVWGDSRYGQAGIMQSYKVFPVQLLENIVDAGCEYYRIWAITKDGDLYMWGYNKEGYLGDGTKDIPDEPVKIMSNVKDVEIYVNEDTMTCAAITKDGALYMWGSNYSGQIGDGTKEDKLKPVKIMDNVEKVTMSSYRTTAAITKNGDLYMWGNNQEGQIGDGTAEDKVLPIRIMENVEDVELYKHNSGAITKDGELYMWGYNFFGQIGDGTTENKLEPVKIMDNVDSVTLCADSSAAITKEGELYMWGGIYDGKKNSSYNGKDTSNVLKPKKMLDDVKKIVIDDVLIGWSSSCAAITNNNELYMWGYNNGRLLGTEIKDVYIVEPTKVLDNVYDVYLSECRYGALTYNGELYRWGYNVHGEKGNGTRDGYYILEDYGKPVKIMENCKVPQEK